MTNKTCKHDWKAYTLAGINFRCNKCFRYGNEVLIYNPKTGRDEYRIRMISR